MRGDDMTGEQIIGLYDTVSQLTEQMLAAAQNSDWDNLVALEAHCASQVQILKASEPADPLPGEFRSRKIEIIHRILDHDRQIRDLTQPWMAQLSTLINSRGAQRKLSAAYGSV